MLKYIITLILILSTSAYAGSTEELRLDQQRGPWIDTIDEDARQYAYNRVTDLTFKGDTALRFELRDGDCYTANLDDPAAGWDDCTRDRERTEVREKWNPRVDTSVWYSIHLYIPEDYEPMYPKQIFWQWHSGVTGPSAYFHLNENKFHIDILAEPGQTTTQYTFGTDILVPGQWHELVVNAVWSNDPSVGRLRLWVNEEVLVSYRGPTMDDIAYEAGVGGPYVKYGIYRSHLFRWTAPEPHPTHVLYFDEYRRGYSAGDVDIRNYNGD